MADFSPDRVLLDPAFQGYRLHVLDPAVVRLELPCKLSQTTAAARSPLSVEEVHSRITHNHLVVADHTALYIDAAHNVVLVDLDVQVPTFAVVFTVPPPRPVDGVLHLEYPSAAFLDPHTVVVGDGHGALFVLALSPRGPATVLSSAALDDSPFRVHSAARMLDGTPVALLSSRHYPPTQPSTNQKHRQPEFDVWAVRLDVPSSPASSTRSLDVLWRLRGADVPILAVCNPARDAFALLASTPYHPLTAAVAHYEPAPDEIAPIPRAGEVLDVDVVAPYPYSWTQTSDAVTLSFALPATTPVSAISVLFAPAALTVHVQPQPPHTRHPRYTAERLWDGVRPDSCIWTWDRDGEHNAASPGNHERGHMLGILSVHLGKANEGLKWMHVFAAAGTRPVDDARIGMDADLEQDTDATIDVPETRDPCELHDVRASLAKHTAGLGAETDTGQLGRGLGLGEGVPSLAQGEADEEIDSVVGRDACVQWVARDGGASTWTSQDAQHGTPAGDRGVQSITLLSTPLPGTAAALSSLVVRTGIDGTLHVLSQCGEGGDAPRWTHTGTFSALAFVLASKQDTRFVFHTPGSVLVFEDGAAGRGQNLYVYRRAEQAGERRKGLWARQSVVRIGEGTAGALLGVGARVDARDGGVLILCLCENQLVLLQGVV